VVDAGNHRGVARLIDTTLYACAKQQNQERGGKDDAQDDHAAGEQQAQKQLF
jgi:hypothetical protein